MSSLNISIEVDSCVLLVPIKYFFLLVLHNTCTNEHVNRIQIGSNKLVPSSRRNTSLAAHTQLGCRRPPWRCGAPAAVLPSARWLLAARDAESLQPAGLALGLRWPPFSGSCPGSAAASGARWPAGWPCSRRKARRRPAAGQDGQETARRWWGSGDWRQVRAGHRSGAWFLGRMSLCGPAGGAGLLDFWAKVEIGTPEACFVVLFLFFQSNT